jgi:steroid 5-alpha reductase family enzyme
VLVAIWTIRVFNRLARKTGRRPEDLQFKRGFNMIRCYMRNCIMFLNT